MSCRSYRNNYRRSRSDWRGDSGSTGSEERTNKLYRSRHSMFLGVCSGFAKWRDIPVTLVRFGVIMLAVFTGFFPVLLGYIVLGLILETEPQYKDNQGYRDFSQSYKENKENVADNIRNEYESIKRRVSRMENDAINREEDWEDRFRRET